MGQGGVGRDKGGATPSEALLFYQKTPCFQSTSLATSQEMRGFGLSVRIGSSVATSVHAAGSWGFRRLLGVEEAGPTVPRQGGRREKQQAVILEDTGPHAVPDDCSSQE